MQLSRYRRIFDYPGLFSVWLASLLGRLQLGLLPLSLLLCVREQTGSFAAAGLVTGVHSIATAASSPFKGRVIDRYGTRRALPPMVGGHALLLIALAALGSHLPLLVLAALGAASGLLRPNITTYMRSLFRRVLGEDASWQAANALEASISPLLLILSPPLAGALITFWGAPTALVICALITLSGSLWFSWSRLQQSPEVQPSGEHSHEAIRWLPIALPLLVGMTYYISFGCLQVALPNWSASHAMLPYTGLLLGSFSAGAVGGGLLYGLRSWALSRHLQLAAFATFSTLAALLLALPDSFILLLLLALAAGLPHACFSACVQDIMQHHSPERRITEVLSWWVVASSSGMALGNAGAGALSQAVSANQLMLSVAAANLLTLLAAGVSWQVARRSGDLLNRRPSVPQD